jgi:hypothetical protein
MMDMAELTLGEAEALRRGREPGLLARSMLAAALQGGDWKLVQRAYVALGGVATGPSDMEPTPYVAPPETPEQKYARERAEHRVVMHARYAAGTIA